MEQLDLAPSYNQSSVHTTHRKDKHYIILARKYEKSYVLLAQKYNKIINTETPIFYMETPQLE